MSVQSSIQSLMQQRLLLQLEYETEKEAFRKQTETIGLARKVKRGDAWWPVKTGKSYYNSMNQLALEIHRTADDDIEHNFEYGRPVRFFTSRTDSPIKYFNFTATVSYVDGDRMVVIVPDNNRLLELQNAEGLGVQLFFDETSYRLMFEGLDRVIKARGNRLAELRDLFYSHRPFGHYTFAPMAFPYLNKTQEEAVNEVLRAKDVAIVHGPPGTGKTTTLVEAINETLMRESQVLVCAQSNMAVDWISEKLVDRGLRGTSRLSAAVEHPQGTARTAPAPQARRLVVSPEDRATEKPCHRTGGAHQQRALWRGTRHCLHADGLCPPPVAGTTI